MREESLKFLRNYINNAAPPGDEADGQEIWLEYIKPFIHSFSSDVNGSVMGIINPEAHFRVVLEAHADQVAFYISYISKDGYLYVTKIGGATPAIAPSKRVKIRTEQNKIIPGIFGWPAPHVKNDKTASPTEDKLTVDVGCNSKKEVESLGIEVGNIVTFEEEFRILNGNFFTGPSLDNCIGGFVLTEIARLISENKIKLPFGLYLVNSAMEEVGKHGALLMAKKAHAQIAIVIDATHDTQSPMYDKKSMGDISLGKGPVITYAPSLHNKLVSQFVDVARKNNIPYQKKAAGKSTGTDAEMFASGDGETVTGLVSFPIKYMHTTLEAANMADIEGVIKLLYNFLLELSPKENYKVV